MNAYGIETAYYHLDQPLATPPKAGEFKWADFLNWAEAQRWNGGNAPTFAGRNFLGGKYQWGHGEGTSAQSAAGTGLQRIAPIQAADPWRQSRDRGEAAGLSYGSEDAAALCRRLATCIANKELSVTDYVIYVFLDVASGTELNPAYWAGWSDTVSFWAVPGAPSPTQPFLPCIRCDFVVADLAASSPKYVPNERIVRCLVGVNADHSDGAQMLYSDYNALCFGFWAKAPFSSQEAPLGALDQYFALDFHRFQIFEQPLSIWKNQGVPVLIWQYLQQAPTKPDDKPKPDFAGGNFVSLNLTNEPTSGPATLVRFLQIESWTNSAAVTTEVGVDAAVAQTNNAPCFGDPATSVSFNRGGRQWRNAPIVYVMRYYKPSTNASLTPAEIDALLKAGLRVGVVWEVFDNLTDLSKANRGFDDARRAFTYAANVTNQPPHTPVYFAFELGDYMHRGPGDINPTDPRVRPAVETYFSDVARGYDKYLQDMTEARSEPVPYSIGAYGHAKTLEFLYEQGIVSYFWQEADPHFGNNDAWLHSNQWQVEVDHTAIPVCKLAAKAVDFDVAWLDEGAWVRWVT